MESNVELQQCKPWYNDIVSLHSHSHISLLYWRACTAGILYVCVCVCICICIYMSFNLNSCFICIYTRQYFLPIGYLVLSNSCNFSCLQWNLMTAWGMKRWFSKAVTLSSACWRMGPSLPKEREPAWTNQFSLNWQRMVHTHKSGRLWSKWHLLTHL